MKLDVEYIGLADLSAKLDDAVIIAEVAAPDTRQPPQDSRLRLMTLADLRQRRSTVERLDLIELAHRRQTAESSAPAIGAMIERALTKSISYLDQHLCSEDDYWGWSQYFDGKTVGVLSTAQGILAHQYSGRPESIDEAVRSLEDMQNPDGGWQVRRALIGRPSEVSITESTCYGLMALLESGRAPIDERIGRAATWLESIQRSDGGWPSSAGAEHTHVVPTALAVRVLSACKRLDAVAKGVSWLRREQDEDGGWAAGARQSGQGTSAAYTAHAVIGLLASGTPQQDEAITRACDYLRAHLNAEAEEPWPPTSINTVVDSSTSTRMEFRHFATPWVLTALAEAGHDLGDPAVLTGVRRLLALQDTDGSWRCSLTAHGSNPIWTLHDAVLALRSVLTANSRRIPLIVTSSYREHERELMESALAYVTSSTGMVRTQKFRHVSLQYAWLSAVTVAVAIVAASQAGLLEGLTSSSAFRHVGSVVITAVVAAVSALAPPILAEEYKIRRNRKRSTEMENK
ncbi:prenyltransferase/squalene oxidase repeat-containing protein [Actinoplanes sp. NPDC049596]|uniref:prenyltransferase/squalene oxidase repeat-containing protein n=1 Tax=unclassified Actinoplanes TaxID=2626549 RepID=UPI00341C018C